MCGGHGHPKPLMVVLIRIRVAPNAGNVERVWSDFN